MKNYDNFIYELNSVPGPDVNKKTTFEEDEETCADSFDQFWYSLENKLDFISDTNNYINKKLESESKDAVILYNDKMRSSKSTKPVTTKNTTIKPVTTNTTTVKPVTTNTTTIKPVKSVKSVKSKDSNDQQYTANF